MMANETLKLTPEMLVPRLGEYLVKKGHVTQDQLQEALAFQQKKIAEGQTALLGGTLLELNIITKDILDQAVTEQIIQLRSALQATNRNLEQRVQERTKELQNALERLSELSKLKANFISNISHELRTPLTHIKGYLELLISESLGSITEEQRHALQVSQRSSARLENLIEDLIMVSITSRGELALKQEALDIRRVANLSVKTVSQKAEERDVSVHAVLDRHLPPVQADQQKLLWVLGQLLDNGVKFTPSGGRVVLRVEHGSDKLVSISVTDTGIGIPQERIEEMFQPFHQLDGAATRRYGGTGLGLLLVRQIVEAHGSMLEVQSAEGRGSTFRFPLLVAKS
jgi:signal transduction histidine kinase